MIMRIYSLAGVLTFVENVMLMRDILGMKGKIASGPICFSHASNRYVESLIIKGDLVLGFSL